MVANATAGQLSHHTLNDLFNRVRCISVLRQTGCWLDFPGEAFFAEKLVELFTQVL